MTEPRTTSQRDATPTTRSGIQVPLALPVAIGALLVIYGYLGGLWLTRHGATPELLALLRRWVNIPFGVGEDFGALGIALLLIAAGYQASVAARRFLAGDRKPAGSWLWAFIPLVILLAGAVAGPHWVDWSGIVAHLLCGVSLVLLGHILQGRGSAQLGHWPAVLLSLGCLATVTITSSGYSELANRWYPLTAVYALLIFLVAMSHGHRVAAWTPIRWLGSRGYLLAIGTGVIGYPLLTLLARATSTSLAYVLALLAMSTCAEASVRIGRALTRVRAQDGAHVR